MQICNFFIEVESWINISPSDINSIKRPRRSTGYAKNTGNYRPEGKLFWSTGNSYHPLCFLLHMLSWFKVVGVKKNHLLGDVVLWCK